MDKVSDVRWILRCTLLITFVFCLENCTFQNKNVEEHKKNDHVLTSIDPVLISAKFCYQNYSDYNVDGINIYYSGLIRNNSFDTLWFPLKNVDLSSSLSDSYFYTVINEDTLYFQEYFPFGTIYPRKIYPQSIDRIELHRYITPRETKWMNIFKTIWKNPEILDTLQIHYLSKDCIEKKSKVVPAISFRRSSKFKVDTVRYYNGFEGVFREQDFTEVPITIPNRSQSADEIWGSYGIVPYRYMYFRFTDRAN